MSIELDANTNTARHEKRPRPVQEILEKNEYANAPYMESMHLFGSNDSHVIELKNNPAGQFPDPPCTQYCFHLVTKGLGQMKYDCGAGTSETTFRKGDFSVSALSVWTDFLVFSEFDLSVIHIAPEIFSEINHAVGNIRSIDIEILHKSMSRNPFVEQLVTRMVMEAKQGCPNGPLFADHSLELLAMELLQIARQGEQPVLKTKPLSDVHLSRIDEILQDQLGEKITLEDIAGELGYNKFHLSKAFSATIGTTLHQYLMQRRLERALGMLSKTSESLANIAYDCGFASQSHMTAVFQKHVGITPGAYRKQKLS